MSRITNSAPTDPTDRFARRFQALEQQVAEVQRPRGTPWTTLSFATNWSAAGSGCKYRRLGDVVYLQGGVTWSGGAVATAPQVVGTLPAGYRPAVLRRFVGWQNNTGIAVRVTVDTNGQVSIDDALATSRSWEISVIVSTTA